MRMHPMRPITPTRPRSGERMSPEALSPLSRQRRYTELFFSDRDKVRHNGDDNLLDEILSMKMQIERISKHLSTGGQSKKSQDRDRLPISESLAQYPSQGSGEKIVGSELDESIYRENIPVYNTRPLTPRMSRYATYAGTYYGVSNPTRSGDDSQDWIEPLQTQHTQGLRMYDIDLRNQNRNASYIDMIKFTDAYDDDELIYFHSHGNKGERINGDAFPKRDYNHDRRRYEDVRNVRDSVMHEIQREDGTYNTGGELESSDYSDQYSDGLVLPKNADSSRRRVGQLESSVDSLERDSGQGVSEQQGKYEDYENQEYSQNRRDKNVAGGNREGSTGLTMSRGNESYSSNKKIFATLLRREEEKRLFSNILHQQHREDRLQNNIMNDRSNESAEHSYRNRLPASMDFSHREESGHQSRTQQNDNDVNIRDGMRQDKENNLVSLDRERSNGALGLRSSYELPDLQGRGPQSLRKEKVTPEYSYIDYHEDEMSCLKTRTSRGREKTSSRAKGDNFLKGVDPDGTSQTAPNPTTIANQLSSRESETEANRLSKTKTWVKREIKNWISDFEKKNKRPPSMEDKKEIQQLYVAYKVLSSQLEQNRNRME